MIQKDKEDMFMKDERTELRERRTASTKTYENPDHSFTKEIYLSPVHYQTEDGSWEEMDDTLADVERPSETGNAAEKTQKKAVDASVERAAALWEATDEAEEAGVLNEEKTQGEAAPAFMNRKGRWQHTQTASQPLRSGTVTTPSPGSWSRQHDQRHAARMIRCWSTRKSRRGSMQNTIPQDRP